MSWFYFIKWFSLFLPAHLFCFFYSGWGENTCIWTKTHRDHINPPYSRWARLNSLRIWFTGEKNTWKCYLTFDFKTQNVRARGKFTQRFLKSKDVEGNSIPQINIFMCPFHPILKESWRQEGKEIVPVSRWACWDWLCYINRMGAITQIRDITVITLPAFLMKNSNVCLKWFQMHFPHHTSSCMKVICNEYLGSF